MNPSSSADHLAVRLQSPDGTQHSVGVLHRSRDYSWFESNSEYWETPDRPILGQVFEQQGRSWRPSANVRLPRWFSHLLPEGRLRDAIATSVGVKPDREFALLQRIGGDDLPGALRIYESDEDGSPPAQTIEATETSHDEPSVLKFSLAGVQLKFSVRSTDRSLSLPATSASGNWIAKLPDPRPGFEFVPEAEFAALEFARAAGIHTVDAELVSAHEIARLPEWAPTEGNALLVRRYDRLGENGRVHAEEFAQVLDIPTGRQTFKYVHANFETIARTAAVLVGEDGLGQVIDRLVVNVIVGNGDAHTKNWSLIYPDGRNPQLSPAYDIVPTVAYVDSDDLGMNLNGSKRFEDVRLDDFARLAEKSGANGDWGWRRAQEAVDRTLDAWPILRAALPGQLIDRLETHRGRLALTR